MNSRVPLQSRHHARTALLSERHPSATAYFLQTELESGPNCSETELFALRPNVGAPGSFTVAGSMRHRGIGSKIGGLLPIAP
jgi:hypothetical protein